MRSRFLDRKDYNNLADYLDKAAIFKSQIRILAKNNITVYTNIFL